MESPPLNVVGGDFDCKIGFSDYLHSLARSGSSYRIVEGKVNCMCGRAQSVLLFLRVGLEARRTLASTLLKMISNKISNSLSDGD